MTDNASAEVEHCVSEKGWALIGNNPEVTVGHKGMSLNAAKKIQIGYCEVCGSKDLLPLSYTETA